MKKNTILWVVILAAGLGLLVFADVGYKRLFKPTQKENPTGGQPKTPISVQYTPSLWETLKGPATCTLKGEIKYITQNTYNNQDALFTYKGVDHPARNIKWTITPTDDLSIGPNIFDRMVLPDGKSLLGIVLPEKPKAKKYTLTASIDYGRLVDGALKVSEQKCSGKTTIVLP